MSEFLLEVGVEEIPDWMIEGALKDLEKRFLAALDKADLREGVTTRTAATPRRLTLIAEGLAEGQADKQEKLSGPPKNVAFDADGNPTKAGLGFAKRAGVEASALEVGPDGKLFIERKIAGRPTTEILAESLPEAILGVYFPKNMYWTGKAGPRFIRPVRRIVALLNGSVVPFEIAGVASGNRTFGHRRLGQSELEVSSVAEYEKALSENGVFLSADERRERISSGAAEALEAIPGAKLRANDKLFRTLVYLTEYPTVIRGEFEETYLDLPDEIIETVMLVHQKYFAIEDASTGKLSNGFIAVANLDGDPEGEIRRGAERVLRARFNDAQFFWAADEKKPLAARVEDLKAVTFQAELGSYHDKITAMRGLAAKLGAAAGVDSAVVQAADRAAELSKTDLTTEMVGEFPELQGVMGGLYAKAQGESQEVADAIYHHYKPAGQGAEIPPTVAGRLVALSDKLHTLGGMFRLGKIPTGSRDPFALRRAAYGIIQILVKGELAVSIDQLVEMADAGEHASALRDFLVERLRYYLGEQGHKYDEINAVLAASDAEPLDADRRAKAIAEVRPTENFVSLAAGFKRIRNILEKAGGVDVYAQKELDESKLEGGAERALFDAYQQLRRDVQSQTDYAASLQGIASLRPQVDQFFDDVLVMAKDEAVRENRLTFLAQLLREFSTIADFSEIVVE